MHGSPRSSAYMHPHSLGFRKPALNKTEASLGPPLPMRQLRLRHALSSHNTPCCCSPPRPPRSPPPSSPGTAPTSHSGPCARCARHSARCARHNARSMGVACALWRAPSAGSPARGTCERPAQTRSRPLPPRPPQPRRCRPLGRRRLIGPVTKRALGRASRVPPPASRVAAPRDAGRSRPRRRAACSRQRALSG
jgi:hypothetical protein